MRVASASSTRSHGAIAVLGLHFHFSDLIVVDASRLIDICRSGGLAGAAATRNAIYSLRPTRHDRRRRRWARAFAAATPDNQAHCDDAREPDGAARGDRAGHRFSSAAAEWAHAPGVLAAFLGGNVAAYRRDNFVLFEGFPEVRAFMDRRSGYLVLLDALSRAEATSEGAGTLALPSELARRHAISRAHVRKLFAAAAAQGWLAYEAGGRVAFRADFYGRGGVESVTNSPGPAACSRRSDTGTIVEIAPGRRGTSPARNSSANRHFITKHTKDRKGRSRTADPGPLNVLGVLNGEFRPRTLRTGPL